MRLFAKSLIAASIAAASMGALAMGGGSGPATNYIMQGHIGEVMMNPYGIAPLTAVIRDGGYDLSNVVVKIQPKLNGQTIEYKVSRTELLTHGGVPVFGLYPDYVNMVEVSYTRTLRGNSENFKDTYQLYAPPTYTEVAGIKAERHALFGTEVKKVDPEFKDRLYFINNIAEKSGIGTRAVWNNPVGGALQWNFFPQNAIIDTAGDIRWYMFANPIYDLRDMYKAGVMMGFKQNDDGLLTWGYGQRYVKYDIMGREVFNRLLPMRYNDYSHSMDDAQNGHYFLRVASSNYIRPDGKHVRTVRDVIAEVDEQGHVIDEWRLPDILDVYRSNVLKVLDQGAVCLNIDAAQAGKTLTAEELSAAEESNDFGDIVGTGAGRNWLHVNSVDYDPEDDSIIISSRHQSAIIKIGRDKKVKWILGAPKGWRSPWKEALLTPVSAKGQKLNCTDVECTDTDFDWTYTQHTAFRVDEKSDKRYCMISVFDNGDARNLDQPALASMKYSRAVIYKIDQKNMTVEQVWEYGKERGHDWYSPVTSLTRYEADKDSVMVYSATAGMDFSLSGGSSTPPRPILNEFEWGAKEPAVEIQMSPGSGYRAFPISVKKAFTEN